MRNLPVHWYEGLFLRPHHFQAADRFWTEALQVSESWDHAYNYGLRALDFSHESIANYQFQVNACQARLRDGTLVSIAPGAELDRLDLKEALAAQPEVRVFLAVPKLKMGSRNVGQAGDGSLSRYTESAQFLQDESAGGNDQEIQLRGLNVRLMLSTQDLAGYEVLPIAQVQRVSEKEAAPQLDVRYVPPVLATDAWVPLGRGFVRAVYDIIGKKLEVLSEQVINRGITLVSQEPGDLDRLLMLMLLNSAYATLGVLAFAQGVHPLVAYTELCRIVGQLSIFAPDRRVEEVPRYDHDDLATIFKWVKDRIEALLQTIRDYQFERRFFVGEGRGMRVSLDPQWFHADWQWFVGVQRGSLSEKDCLALLSSGGLDWKLGSARQVDGLFEHGVEGLRLTPLPQAPRALPPRRDWAYFEVTRGNAAWKDVLETQTLAMRLKDSLIANAAELQGKQELVVSISGKRATLQFALFAVPTRG
jgi:type VI secretion system protein ImpJ